MNKWDRYFLELAEFISRPSKDPSTKVGSVIVDSDRRIVSTGYNGFARGVIDSPERLNNRDIKYKLVIHAERNAIIFARQDLRGCTIYTWPFMPCAVCAGMIIQSGIARVVAPLNDAPRWQEEFKLSKEQFEEANILLDLFDL
jgi:dCMP deaminase